MGGKRYQSPRENQQASPGFDGAPSLDHEKAYADARGDQEERDELRLKSVIPARLLQPPGIRPRGHHRAMEVKAAQARHP
jgi:hypothetical protein